MHLCWLFLQQSEEAISKNCRIRHGPNPFRSPNIKSHPIVDANLDQMMKDVILLLNAVIDQLEGCLHSQSPDGVIIVAVIEVNLVFRMHAINDLHWGQRGIYPVGTLWVHCGFWNNLPTTNPVGKWWVLLKSTHWCDLNKPSGYFSNVLSEFFHKIPTECPANTSWTNPLISFTIYPLMWFEQTPWVCSRFVYNLPTKIPNGYILNEFPEFFYKIPTNVITMYPVGSL